MDKARKSQQNLIQDSPEVKAFIYQTISAFEPFVTPETVVAVVAKNPLKVYEDILDAGMDVSKQEVKSWHRISITLQEGESKIEAEAVDRDIFLAITKAKDKLVAHLAEIQDKVVTQQERIEAINTALQNTQLH